MKNSPHLKRNEIPCPLDWIQRENFLNSFPTACAVPHAEAAVHGPTMQHAGLLSCSGKQPAWLHLSVGSQQLTVNITSVPQRPGGGEEGSVGHSLMYKERFICQCLLCALKRVCFCFLCTVLLICSSRLALFAWLVFSLTCLGISWLFPTLPSGHDRWCSWMQSHT